MLTFFDVDEADEDDVDLAVQVGDQVGSSTFAAVGAEVDRPFERLVRAAASRPSPCRGSTSPGNRPSLNWTLVQGLLMWRWSMNSVFGRITVVEAMLAWPFGAFKDAVSAGLPARLVWPLIAER